MKRRLFLLLCVPLAARAAPPADPAAGARLFASRCASCHGVGPSARGGFGPQLNALFGRTAGATPGYAYSAAMKKSRIVWDERTLRAFLADPDEVVPDTRMRFWGMGNERQVGDLLAYLRSFQPAGGIAPVAPATRR
ncbi:c-type cytochrome [Massilia sp. Dwa41.01b]|uniref:c-type cytochrome n=1 Tax=Massilia sp. Dwa41.01b TaxID=2709302 RepID=UPI0016025C52|nr:c-type cytochrome [Massilia sp. Dwa41.01b]QNA89176.1 c-type cytochrome [Massilia sp. Dwa41.01b]